MQKKILFLLFYLCTLQMITVSAYAITKNQEQLDVPVAIYLEAINVKKPVRVKDKIYLQITEYSSITKAKEYRIPTYPKHWLANDLPKLKNTILWKGKVKDLEHKELILSLVESEYPPLDTDEPLGSVKLIINNSNNNIMTMWDKASFKEPIQIHKITEKHGANHVTFQMQGKNSEYIISFYVKTH